MEDVVRVLPENLANQIKAGEVVERPASVVKELLENAIDAGVHNISLFVENGGKTLIKVVDDGCGMSAHDAELCLSRHTTSKIYSQKDLFSIATLGFRGEALASIGSVSLLTLKTRKKEVEVGHKVVMENGKIILHEPCQTPVGTTIEVANLFYNIPARFKFLKTNTTESKHILQELFRVALPNPQVAFTYFNNKSVIYKFPKESFENRLTKIWGESSLEKFLPVSEETSMMRISGYVSKAEYGQRGGGGQQYIFVNQRFVRSPMINKAVRQSFERLMDQDKSPSFAMFIEIDPEKVNINIHPKKIEVKFEDEAAIFKIIQAVIRKSIGQFQIEKNPAITLGVDLIETYKKSSSSFISQKGKNQSLYQNTFKQTDLIKDSQLSESISPENLPTPMDVWESELMEKVEAHFSPDKVESILDMNQDDLLYQKEESFWKQGYAQKIHPKYAINITVESFFIIHLQRMYEVLFYEHLIGEKQTNFYASENLLIPIELEFTNPQLKKIEVIDPFLKKIGLILSIRRSKSVVVVKALPSFFAKTNLKEFIERIISEQELFQKTEKNKVWLEYAKDLSVKLAKIKFLHISNLKEDIHRFFPHKKKYRYTLFGKLIYIQKKLNQIYSEFDGKSQYKESSE